MVVFVAVGFYITQVAGLVSRTLGSLAGGRECEVEERTKHSWQQLLLAVLLRRLSDGQLLLRQQVLCIEGVLPVERRGGGRRRRIAASLHGGFGDLPCASGKRRLVHGAWRVNWSHGEPTRLEE